MSEEEIEALYPAEFHIKVIAVDLGGMEHVLNTVMQELGYDGQSFAPGNRSKGGKYISYNATLIIDTHDLMIQIDTTLRSISGVKMVL